MIDEEVFLSKYYNEANEAKQNNVRAYISHFCELMGEKTLCEALNTPLLVCNSFYIRKANTISKAHYYRIKEYLLNLYDYAGVEPTIPTHEEVLAVRTTTTFFRDLDHLLGLIDQSGRALLPDYDASCDLAVVKSLVILSWYGLSSQEILALTASSLRQSEGGCNICLQDRIIPIERKYFLILSELSMLESYKGLPSGKVVVLKDNSSLLFRPSVNSLSDSPRREFVTQTFDRFNDVVSPRFGYSIYFRNLHKNAMFIDVYNDNSKKSIEEKIVEHTGCSYALKYGYIKKYNYWLKLYY